MSMCPALDSLLCTINDYQLTIMNAFTVGIKMNALFTISNTKMILKFFCLHIALCKGKEFHIIFLNLPPESLICNTLSSLCMSIILMHA